MPASTPASTPESSPAAQPRISTAVAAPVAILSALGAVVCLFLFAHAFSVIEWECVASRCTTDAPQAYYGLGGLALVIMTAVFGARFLRGALPTAVPALGALALAAGLWASLSDGNTSAGWTPTYAVIVSLIGVALLARAAVTGSRAFVRSGIRQRLGTTRVWADARLTAVDRAAAVKRDAATDRDTATPREPSTGLAHFRTPDGTRHVARVVVPAWAHEAAVRVICDPASPTDSVTVAEQPPLWWPPAARARRKAIAADLPVPGEQTFSPEAKTEADEARATIGLPPAGEAYVPTLSPFMKGLARTVRAANSARAAFREGQANPDDAPDNRS